MIPTLGTWAECRLDRESGYRFRVEFARGAPGLVMDEAPSLGDRAGPDASALLAAAIGHCLASSLVSCAHAAVVDPEALAVEVSMTPERDEYGRIRVGRVRVRLEPTLTESENARLRPFLERFEEFSMVAESVQRGIPVDLDITPVAARPDRTLLVGALPATKGGPA
jgi:organic hydroperoxide reductase OsmC/OhrA